MHPPHRLLDEAVKLGEQLAGTSPMALKHTRNLLQQNAFESDFDLIVQRERDAVEACRASRQHQEVRTAFGEKRPVNFSRAPERGVH